MFESRHIPVLLEKTLDVLQVKAGGVYLDCTVDGGGHSKALLERSAPDGIVIGLDMDQLMIERSKERLAEYGSRMKFVHSNFAELKEAILKTGITEVDGIMADLGISSNQLDFADRGFSFMQNGPIDMRMNTNLEETALDVIINREENELANIIFKYGEEKLSRKIAKVLKQKALKNELKSTLNLAETVANAIPRKMHPRKIHPATRTFQALRIEVNHELESIEQMLPQALEVLKPGGRLAIMTYHSLEDRIVQSCFKSWDKSCTCPPKLPVCVCNKIREAKIVNRKPILPEASEIIQNPRARSVKLRVVEKTS